MKNYFAKCLIFCCLMSMAGCINDLNVTPIDPNKHTAEKVYKSEEDLMSGLGKLYNGLSHTGQYGPAGDQDLDDVDEGTSNYWRTYWNIQELSTDEAINGWNDNGLDELNYGLVNASNLITRAMYYRLVYEVVLTNEFIRKAEEVRKPSWKNVPQMIAEARFLRALSYYNCLELFGNGVPFVTEADPIGSFLPKPAGKQFGHELFDYIEKELRAISGLDDSDAQLADARQGYIGRADKGAALALLAKLYLNHKSFFSEDGQVENADYYQKGAQVIDLLTTAGYGVVAKADLPANAKFSAYQSLFLADNQNQQKEIMFQLSYDGRYMQSWGGATFLTCGAILNNMNAAYFGVNEGWNGTRGLWNLYHNFHQKTDLRAQADSIFYTQGRQIDGPIDLKDANTGFGVGKFRNVNIDGTLATNDGKNVMVDVNIPVFRYADVILMAAEFDLRLGKSVSANHLALINELQKRAGNREISSSSAIDLDWILQERGRELYWEGCRRTDLIRFNKYTSGTAPYVWAYKGGQVNGRALPMQARWLPIPASDISANPNIIQNKGY
ncbi:RagB/SusD family nutrient uptake outer membrane protein [Persicobacter psychrovividus]|uniref:Outer membrane protein n=1 Tax=Persicobacter psychrovividus TaxID=387638 RepID=A0ABM7VHY1_9BACT|nr:outer membrane protein [Persicobacter psychrovividus]